MVTAVAIDNWTALYIATAICCSIARVWRYRSLSIAPWEVRTRSTVETDATSHLLCPNSGDDGENSI